MITSRRRFLARTSILSAAALFGLRRRASAEPQPEVTRIRLVHDISICFAPNTWQRSYCTWRALPR